MLAHSVEGVFWKRRSLRPTQSFAFCVKCARLLFCLRSHRSGSFETTCAIALLIAFGASCDPMPSPSLSGMFSILQSSLVVDHHWKGMACCCVLVGIVHAVPF